MSRQTVGAIGARIAIISPVLVISLLWPLHGRAENGPYLGITTGGVDYQDYSAGAVDVEQSTGFMFGGRFGFRISQLRLEAELGYQATEAESSNGIEADVDILRFTGGAYYDFAATDSLAPYLGGGLGFAGLDADGDFEDEDSAFTWHAEAGLGIDITPNLTLSPAYRFQWIDSTLGGADEAQTANLLTVTLSYQLGQVTPSGRQAVRPQGYGYDPYPYNSYRPGYRGRYNDPYYGRHRHRGRDNTPSSPEKKERDRCGFEGPGCDDGARDGFEG